MPRLLDLFCGRWGWSRAFAARGWECIGVDLQEPPEVPANCRWSGADILKCWIDANGYFCGPLGFPAFKPDFIVASSPCEQFSVHGMKHFHPNPPYPELGIKLFNHTRAICEASGVPYVMENVRAAQQFVGRAQHHCGPFYLWGNAVPPLMPQGIAKGTKAAAGTKEEFFKIRDRQGKNRAGHMAVIPEELSSCVADYAEALRKVTQP